MTRLTITLRDEDQHFIDSALKSGRYHTESEAVADAIAELRAREELHQARLKDLQEKVSIGITQLDQGQGSAWDANAVKVKGQALIASRIKP
jgi:putative addiction module CopG family antidote